MLVVHKVRHFRLLARQRKSQLFGTAAGFGRHRLPSVEGRQIGRSLRERGSG